MPKTSKNSATKVGFVSLGCPKNLVDSEVMLGMVSENGFEVTSNCDSADVIVVNTCGFIDSAKKESIDTILEMAQYKLEGSCKKLVVAGCLAERYRTEIRSEIPEIDFVFGPDELGKILSAVNIDQDPVLPEIDVDSLYSSTQVPTIPRILTTPSHFAYLKISEGCDHTCSFCAIPGFRGSFRSRPLDDLESEARRLAKAGVRELIIVSQDTLAYGKDLGIADGTQMLLRRLLKVKEISWIRLLYCYPNLLSNDLIELIESEDRLCNYFDIPFQHASGPILERMRRGGNRTNFEKQLSAIRNVIPGAGIRTSFIVGFPGETDNDFEELMEFTRKARFDNLGVFLYSDEENTAAFDLESKIPRSKAEERRNLLMSEQKQISTEKLRSLIGRRFDMLLDGFSDESDLLLKGRLETQAPDIDGHILINDALDPGPESGGFYEVEITDTLEYDLIGRIIGQSS